MRGLTARLGLDEVRPTPSELAAALPGDGLVTGADAVMDRAFTVPAPPREVWPWLVQLGKRRAGWYLPRRVDRLLPPSRRAIRHLDPQWQGMSVGQVIPDYGGRHETFTVHEMVRESVLVYSSRRGAMDVSWAMRLTPVGDQQTRVHLRLRLGPVKRLWLVRTAGELVDLLTIAGMATGLRERAASPARD